MNNSDKALSFEQSRNLLLDEFRPNAELTGRKKLLNTPMGLIDYHYSSLLKDGLWYILIFCIEEAIYSIIRKILKHLVKLFSLKISYIGFFL
ncbi:MAG: hypothetical protein K2H46_07525 [Muribaculaceae bacterium]|nr:hypothetical protein [Muribaculaceae bacterium]